MLKIILRVVFFIYVIMLCGCVYTSTGSGDQILKIDFEKNNSNFKIENIDLVSGKKSLNEGRNISIHFSSIHGGKTLLFGKIPISEGDVTKAKRLNVMCEDYQYHFTIDEIMLWEKVDSILIAPKICE